MPNEPNWLPLGPVIEINRDAVSRTPGENHALLDQGALEAALARPKNHWDHGETDVVVLAVVLLEGIAQNHCFEQGNKRTAFTAAVMFLKANGYNLTLPDSEMPTGRFVNHLVTKVYTPATFVDIIRPFVEPIEAIA